MVVIVVETGVPQPDPRLRPTVTVYPFGGMEVDQSIFIPTKDVANPRGAANMYRRRHPGWRYRSATVIEEGVRGVRIWRTA